MILPRKPQLCQECGAPLRLEMEFDLCQCLECQELNWPTAEEINDARNEFSGFEDAKRPACLQAGPNAPNPARLRQLDGRGRGSARPI